MYYLTFKKCQVNKTIIDAFNLSSIKAFFHLLLFLVSSISKLQASSITSFLVVIM